MKALKRIAAIAFAALAAATLASCAKKSENTLSATVTVDCTRVYSELDSEIMPKDGEGYFLKDKEVSFAEGDSAVEVLTEALTSEKLTFDISDGYIKGIANVNTGDFGELSGWLYSVNGEMPNVGADEYIVSSGDSISFVYYSDYNEAFTQDETEN